MRKLDHPGILKMYEIHETPRSIYMILELMEGGRLLDLIEKCRKKEAKTTDNDIANLIKRLLIILQYTHKQNIMHRDIKLENLIFRKKDSVKEICLVDFGLSTMKDEEVYLYYKCGTPGYVAPEVLNLIENSHEKYNEKCDVFSLGVVLFILYMHFPPFYDKVQKNIIAKNKNCELDFKNAKLKMNPDAFSLFCLMIDKNPETRVSCTEALEHPFIKQCYDMEDAPNLDLSCDLDHTSNDFYGVPISVTIPKFNQDHILDFHEKNYLSKSKISFSYSHTETFKSKLKGENDVGTTKSKKKRNSEKDINPLNAEAMIHDLAGMSFPASIVVRTAIFTGLIKYFYALRFNGNNKKL